MRIPLAILLGLLAVSKASSEPLDFTVYHLNGEERALIAQGKLDYTVRDIDVQQWESKDGQPACKKSLALGMGFRIGTMIVRTSEVSGFGLWIRNDHHPDGFSWEWFYQESGSVYRKLQGEGRVRITQAHFPDGVELQSVEFLSDITLRFQEDVSLGPGNETHEVVVSQGSVLRVAP